jgi:CDP-glycerol glycerophosphotransferase
MRLVLRGHHNTAKDTGVCRPGIIDATYYPDINDLLLVADLLITDYSSVMFDYAVTGKPMIFLAPDLEQYRDETRGFYLDFEETVPGPICRTNDELFETLSSLGDAMETYSERYHQFKARFTSQDDGGAAARVVDAVWGGG